jgi:excisionase family DNA binding protein
MAATMEDSLSTVEVAEQIGVSESTVRNMIRDGRLRAFRPSGAKRGQYRVLTSEVVRHQIETGQLAEPAAA